MAYSGVFVFGDSLVDAGNALKLAQWYGGLPFTDLPDGAPTASLGYFQGRFSNGYNFADLVANKTIGVVTKTIFPYFFEDPWLGIKIDPFASDPKGNNLNFAYGGAQIRQGDEVVPDLDGQTDAFRHAVDGDADPNALYLITMGGNDVRSLVPSGSDPASAADAHLALDEAADKLLHELTQLIEIGVQNILITGIPDVGLIPQYDRDGNLVLEGAEALRSAAATKYSIYLDTLIRTEVVPALQALGAVVTYVPLMDYVDASGNLVTGALNANLGTIAALHGLTVDELSGNLLQYQNLLFFDQVHPNAQANALLGAYMYAQLTGTPWIETLPLTGADVDYRLVSNISAAGEVDTMIVSLVAGTTYRVEMLGISALGTPGSLADPSLRLLGPDGAVVGFSADDGVGFDASLTFTAAATGSYTIELFSTGIPTGTYAVQAAVVGGAAMLAGNTYTISNALTVVLEGAGGVGQDVVKASVSYALSEGSEIEVLRTTNDHGKIAINLTGNEFNQTIVGNSGNNILEGKGGADLLTGGAGNDIFVLSNAAVTNPGSANIDRISDYAKGDIVDVTQILSVAAGTNVIAGGYLRVTTSGLVQVDLNGGGNDWVTLSTINGSGAVAVRYLSGGAMMNLSINRVAETQLKSMSAENSSIALASAVAAAGLIAGPAAAESPRDNGLDAAANALVVSQASDWHIGSAEGPIPSTVVSGLQELSNQGVTAHSPGSAQPAMSPAFDANALVGGHAQPAVAPIELLHGTDTPAFADSIPNVSLVTTAIAMPSAEMLRAASPTAEIANTAAEVARVLADTLTGGGDQAQSIASLLDAWPGTVQPVTAAFASQFAASLETSHGDILAAFNSVHSAFAMEAATLHYDAPIPA
jgi:phospholipase/lecithinase/hemolysin